MRRYGYRPQLEINTGDRVTIYELTVHIVSSITRQVLWPKGTVTLVNNELATIKWDNGFGSSTHPVDKLKKL
jgi:hypothetical protein